MLHAPSTRPVFLAHLAPVRTLQDSPYTYAGDQTKVNLAEENSTGVKDEPAKDKWVALTIKHTDGSALKPRFLADPALSVHQLLHQPLLWLERCLWATTPSSRCVLSRRPGGLVFSTTWRSSGMCLLTNNLVAQREKSGPSGRSSCCP